MFGLAIRSVNHNLVKSSTAVMSWLIYSSALEWAKISSAPKPLLSLAVMLISGKELLILISCTKSDRVPEKVAEKVVKGWGKGLPTCGGIFCLCGNLNKI